MNVHEKNELLNAVIEYLCDNLSVETRLQHSEGDLFVVTKVDLFAKEPEVTKNISTSVEKFPGEALGTVVCKATHVELHQDHHHKEFVATLRPTLPPF